MTVNDVMMKNLKMYLEENASFAKILILKKGPVTSTLFDEIPDLTAFPACVIAGGNMRTLNGGVTHECDVEITVISPYYGGLDCELEKGLDLLHETTLLLQCDRQGKVLHMGNYYYLFDRVEEMFLSGEFLAWKICLNVKYSLDR